MRLLLSCALAATCMSGAAVAATGVNPVSWGKTGVTIEQYRQDAVECGTAAYYMDLADTEAAQIFKRASQRLENNEANLGTLAGSDFYTMVRLAARSDEIVKGTRPSIRLRELRNYQQLGLSTCLGDRGYKRFTLTKEQQEHVRHLKKGSPERHAYLYSLAVNPTVLNNQAL